MLILLNYRKLVEFLYFHGKQQLRSQRRMGLDYQNFKEKQMNNELCTFQY